MSDMLSIGASGVYAYQNALATVSENIANSGVAGYSRRSTTLSEILTTGGGVASRNTTAGQGVAATGIARAGDVYKTAAVRSSAADLAKTQTGATWLDQIQSALTGNSLGDRLTSFYASATTLAADPTSSASRSTMLGTATSTAASFTATGKALQTVSDNLDSTAQDSVAQLTTLGQTLAKINDGLSRTSPNTTGAAQLSDQRDQVLDQMSAITDIAVTTDQAGRATVNVGGTGGPVLVSGSDSASVAYSRNGEGAVGFTVTMNGSVSTLAPNGGALAGIVDGAQKVADATTTLNGIATDFTTQVNTVQAQGRDLNGQPGAAMFATGATPTSVTVALDDPTGIAAASVGGGTRDGSNLDALQAARTSSAVETRTTTLVAGNAAALAQRQSVATAQTAINDSAVAARDAVSSVDLDTEAVDLLRFQQAYSAASRVIQVARDTFQSIIAIN